MINWIAKLINDQYKKRLEKVEDPKKKVVKGNRHGFVTFDDFIVKNYQEPEDFENEMYKNGRSGFAGTSGVVGKSGSVGLPF